MENLKKIGIFIALFLGIIGVGCGIGWAIYLKEWFMLIGQLVVDGFAVPTFISLGKKLME